MEIAGNLREIHGEMKYEWEIKDFLSLDDKSGEGYKSSPFSFYGVSWEIWLYPYGEKRNETVGYISVFLMPMSLPKPVTINYSFSLKTTKGDSDSEGAHAKLFDKEKSGYGTTKIILRSNVIERKSELLPSGALTVICKLKNKEPDVATEKTFLNASSQTEKRAVLLDTSAQTEEGIGVWKLQQHLFEIALNEDASDVILKVQDQEFKSHRCILAARSPVFSAMLKNEMKENVTGVADIPDIDPKTFADFLNYLYTGSTKYITSENVAKMYTAADKYQVEVLKKNCLDYMLENVFVENFCDIFILSLQHNEEKLKETCIQYFAKHSLHIIETCKWQSCLSENPVVCNELFIKFLRLNKMNMFDDNDNDDDLDSEDNDNDDDLDSDDDDSDFFN